MALNRHHARRYKDIVSLLLKFGQADKSNLALNDLVHSAVGDLSLENAEFAAPADALTPVLPEAEGPVCILPDDTCKEEAFVKELEKMGGAFVRLGQLLRLRPDILPLSYIRALAQLDLTVEPMSYPELDAHLEAELARPVSEAFRTFDYSPLYVSVFAQSHKAVLPDGKQVLVKILKPQIRDSVFDDLNALSEFAKFYDQYLKGASRLHFQHAVTEFSKVILAEVDFKQEASTLKSLRANLKNLDTIVIPQVVDSYCTRSLLTMSYIDGRAVTTTNVLGFLNTQRAKLAEELYQACLQQMLIDGLLQAYVEPAHMLLTASGRLAFLEPGVIVRLTPSMQEKLLHLLLTVMEGRAETVAEMFESMGIKLASFDEVAFRKAVMDFVLAHRQVTSGQSIKRMGLGKVFEGIGQSAVTYGLVLPSELALIGVCFMNLEAVVHVLDSRFDAEKYMHRYVVESMRHHMMKALSPGQLFQSAVEVLQFMEKLPLKINQILENIASNKLKVTVQTIDEKVLISGFQKIANRITIGLVLAALIIGASMLMNIPTTFRLWGYPGFAIIAFLLAFGCGFALVLEILVGDWRSSHLS